MIGQILLAIAAALTLGGRKTRQEKREHQETVEAVSSHPGGCLVALIAVGIVIALLASFLSDKSPSVKLGTILLVFVYGKMLLIAAVVITILVALFRGGSGGGSVQIPDDNRPRFGWPALSVLGLGALAAFGLYLENRYTRPATVAAATPRIDSGAEEREPEKPVDEEHDALVIRAEELRAEALRRWRSDVEEAGLSGPPGMTPPMLTVTQDYVRSWVVENRSTKPLCVRLRRVIAEPVTPRGWWYCDADNEGDCHDIEAGEKQIVQLEKGCRGELEFRVGDALNPEPTWWSTSALAEFDREHDAADPDSTDSGLAEWTTLELRAEVARLDDMLSEFDRAARWKREYAAK